MKTKTPILVRKATITLSDSFPWQTDHFTCGVFCCKGADTFYQTQDRTITWPENIIDYRNKMKTFYLQLFLSNNPI